MSRSLNLYLDDIIESIDKIERYTTGMTLESFVADERTFDAVARNLQIIGEAVKNIPTNLRDRYSEIEWRKIAGLRDFLAHAYFSIDDEIIWDIIQTKLTDLYRCVTVMKANL
ncbi:MAG: DUF86 domain-containing protein [Cyanobacteria bacterium P01_E01_bin.42]